jgi:hypothetical protein
MERPDDLKLHPVMLRNAMDLPDKNDIDHFKIPHHVVESDDTFVADPQNFVLTHHAGNEDGERGEQEAGHCYDASLSHVLIFSRSWQDVKSRR